MFRAIYLTKSEDGKTEANLKNLEVSDLPNFDQSSVTVAIKYSMNS